MSTEIALIKAMIALAPTGALLAGAAMMFSRERAPASVLQLIGAGCLFLVTLTHVCEALRLFPGMRWGDADSAGHFLDLAAAAVGLTLFPIGYLLHQLRAARVELTARR